MFSPYLLISCKNRARIKRNQIPWLMEASVCAVAVS